MTSEQEKIAKMYESGATSKEIKENFGVSTQYILHSVAVYRREKRIADEQRCKNCRWKCGERPCVWPKSMCEV